MVEWFTPCLMSSEGGVVNVVNSFMVVWLLMPALAETMRRSCEVLIIVPMPSFTSNHIKF